MILGVLAVLAGGAEALAEQLPRRKPLSSDMIRKEKQTDSFGYPLAMADKVEVLRLLRSGDYADLDRILSRYEADAEADVHREDWIGSAIEAFRVPDPDLQAPLDRWIEKMPKSAVARLARGAYWDGLAWEARGAKMAKETTGSQVDAMREYSGRALQDVQQAIVLNPRLAEAHRYLVNIHNTNGRRLDSTQAFNAGVKVQPASFRIRAAYMNALLPRWGGSYAAMERLAAESETHASENKRLEVLRGYIPWDRGNSLPKSQGAERRRAYLEALSYGPHWLFFLDAGRERELANRDDEALEAYLNADAQVPQNARALRLVATMLLREKKVDQARAALAAADAFDLAGAEKDKRSRMEAGVLVARGHEAYQKGDSETALAELKQAQKKHPPSSQSHYWQGRTYLKEGDLERALAEFESAVGVNPRDIESYKNIDFLLAKQGKWDAVISRWNEYLAVEPGSGEGYLERGGAYFHKGDRESALADAGRAYKLGSQKGCEVARQFAAAGQRQ